MQRRLAGSVALMAAAAALVSCEPWFGDPGPPPDPHGDPIAPVIDRDSLRVLNSSFYVTLAGTTETFAVEYSGARATTWSWDFGGGASPNTSTLETPAASLATPGEYTARVTVTNEYGSDSAEFTYSVEMPARPNLLYAGVDPRPVRSGQPLYITAGIDHSQYGIWNWPTERWEWDLAGGAQVTANHGSWLDATALAPGEYNASVTLINAGGSRTLEFAFTVVP